MLIETLTRHVHIARRSKEEAVALATSRDPADTNMPNVIEVRRGGRQIAVAMMQIMDRDATLMCARALAMGFSADEMVVTMETWGTRTPINPRTGKEWEPGELQAAIHEDDALEKGYVHEQLVTTIVTRDGQLDATLSPFRISRTTESERVVCSVEWYDHPGTQDVALQMSGPVLEVLQQAMNGPTLDAEVFASAEMDPKVFGLTDEEQARDHIDVAAMRFFAEKGFPMVVQVSAEPGTYREGLMRRRFGDPMDR